MYFIALVLVGEQVRFCCGGTKPALTPGYNKTYKSDERPEKESRTTNSQ